MLAGHPRENELSNYEMEIRTRRAKEGRTANRSWWAEVSELGSERKFFIGMSSQAENPRKGSQKRHTEASPNH